MDQVSQQEPELASELGPKSLGGIAESLHTGRIRFASPMRAGDGFGFGT